MSFEKRNALRESVQNELNRLESMSEMDRKLYTHWDDDRILCMTGIGVSFLGDKNYQTAESWFTRVIDLEKSIILDHW